MASSSASYVIINNHRTIPVDNVSNDGVKVQVHQAVANSVGQEIFTKGVYSYRRETRKANVP